MVKIHRKRFPRWCADVCCERWQLAQTRRKWRLNKLKSSLWGTSHSEQKNRWRNLGNEDRRINCFQTLDQAIHDNVRRFGDRNGKWKKGSVISRALISDGKSMRVFTVYDNPVDVGEKCEPPPSDKLVNSAWLIYVSGPTENNNGCSRSHSGSSIRHSCHMVWITHASCTDHVKLSRSSLTSIQSTHESIQKDNSLFHKHKKLFITQVWKVGKYQIFRLSVIASCAKPGLSVVLNPLLLHSLFGNTLEASIRTSNVNER